MRGKFKATRHPWVKPPSHREGRQTPHLLLLERPVLFNGYDFLFAFLPLALLGHRRALKLGPREGMSWLIIASLFFYGRWYWPYLLLLLASILFNFRIGRTLSDAHASGRPDKNILMAGIVCNLGLLGYFKYGAFISENVALLGVDLGVPSMALPLAISFFTFQQIAYLVDAHRGLTRAHDLTDYTLFVSFFPQLVAGPIVHHREMLPQFAEGRAPEASDRAIGFTMFTLGLAKKVLIADALAPYANVAFDNLGPDSQPSFVYAWTGVLAYHFQLYFDFSGYSDMAIGLARMFGVKLPANFDAPYRASDIGAFWRQWHMTLSRFLRDYIYIPLGGNRKGELRRNFNLFATMFVGGLWHGAGWTYVLWGGLHGVYLVIHQQWRRVSGFSDSPGGEAIGRVITWIAVLAGWPLFRAENLHESGLLLQAMFGGSTLGVHQVNLNLWVTFFILTLVTQLAPTTQRWLHEHEPTLRAGRGDALTWPAALTWAPTRRWALLIGLLALACVPVLERADAFLYWNF